MAKLGFSLSLRRGRSRNSFCAAPLGVLRRLLLGIGMLGAREPMSATFVVMRFGATPRIVALGLFLLLSACGGGGGSGPGSSPVRTAPPPPEVSGTPVEIPDRNLRRVLERALGKTSGETITDAELRTLSGIRGSREGIASLTGLEHATALTFAYLDENDIADIAPLAPLASLARLDLGGNHVSDLAPLSELRSLEHLSIWSNRVSDLSPLSGLTSLEYLAFTRNGVSDLSPLTGLTSLEQLFAEANNISDLRPLRDLAALTRLYLGINRIVDLSPLSGLSALEELTLSVNPVANVEPLSPLTALRYLSMYGLEAVEDLSFLTGMAELRSLYVDSTSVKDLAPMAGLRKLELLSVGETEVEDLSPLAELTSLRRLFIHSLSVDLQPLAGLASLEAVWQTNWRTADARPKVDIAPLAGLANLQTLAASPLRGDLSPLADLNSLQRLILRQPGLPFESQSVLRRLTGLRELTLDHGGLEDISPLSALVGLEELDVEGNRIESLAPLTGLEQLSVLNLKDNRITDVAALAANLGLGAGDAITLAGNPLGADALRTHIPELEARGAAVAYDRDDFPDSPLRELRDGAVSMRVEADLDTAVRKRELDLEAHAREFIAHFGDEFDVLMFVSALPQLSYHADPQYSGVYYRASNETRGIGRDLFRDEAYGSMRLKGVIHFHWLGALANGPALHELMHMWANYVVPAPHEYGAHWGFSSAAGQLGGFRLEDLADLGGGRWSAGVFGAYANGGNGVPYSPWELYLGGFIGPDEVPDLWHAPDGHWTGERTAAGHRIFEALGHAMVSVGDVVAEHGPRDPGHEAAPKALRGAVIVLEDDDYALHHWDELLEQVRWLSHPGPDWSFGRAYNYHEATGGRGRLVLDGLRALRRETPLSGLPAPRLERVCPAPGAPMGVAPRLLTAPLASRVYWPAPRDSVVEPPLAAMSVDAGQN